MFALHTANRTEILFEQLMTVLEHYTYTPFEPLHFLIQGRGLERWLKMQLAKAQGAFASGRFDFPNRFFATLAQAMGLRLTDSAFERHRLIWLLDELLASPRFRSDPAFKPYLDGPGPELRRFQLARQLANLFDQYQIQRRDWLTVWQRGGMVGGNLDRSVERWQAALWHALYQRLGGHRGELWEALLDRLRRDAPLGIPLPPAVYVFGVSFLPPLMVEVLSALARRTDVHWFLLTPVEGYWADLPGKRRRAQAVLKDGPEGAWELAHHPLLVALGKRGAQFQRLLLECVEPALESSAFPRHDPPLNLLQHLQNDLARGEMTPLPAGIDPGIELHRCHTPLREVEVARERILTFLAEDPSLRLEEIAVMAPDIGAYQPYLEAVFADLPHHVADRSLGRCNPLLEVLIAALELFTSRFEWAAVLELLGHRPVRERFGLSSTQLQQVECWVRAAAIRWGLDGAHRASLGLPASEHNAWRLGIDRMLLGWMAGSLEEWRELVPFAEIEGQAGGALLRLADFLRVLQDFWRRFQTPQPPSKWRRALFAFTQELFADTPETFTARQALEALLETLPEDSDYPGKVGLSVIIDWLRSRVEEVVSDDFLSSGITCCTLLPMRAVPFRLTVVVGLNDGEFPRHETHPAFDLIASHPRLGDRDLRQELRYQFLEVILSTRKHLVLICQGLTPEKNEERPPAQVVSELIDVLDQYGLERRRWIFNHPSHPFHPAYFQASALPPCRDPQRFPVALALLQSGKADPFWPKGFCLSEPVPKKLEFAELLDFATDPQGWFCQRRLKLARLEQEKLPEAREPFAADGLDAFRLRQRLLEACQKGEDAAALLHRAWRAGEWPQGEAGRQAFEIARAQVRALLDAASACAAGALLPPVSVEVEVAGVTLQGRLEHRFQSGTLLVEPGRLKGKRWIHAWLCHLLAQSQGLAPTWLVTLPEAKEQEEKISTLTFDREPRWQELLSRWVRHLLEHWNRPSPWLPEWGFWLWKLKDQGAHFQTAEMVAKWQQACLQQDLPEAFTLLFGQPDVGFFEQVLPVYRRLLGEPA